MATNGYTQKPYVAKLTNAILTIPKKHFMGFIRA